MKMSGVIGLLALQAVVFALILAGVVAFNRYEKARIESRAELVDAHAKALEAQLSMLDNDRSRAALRETERDREILILQALNRELTQRVTDQKMTPKINVERGADIPFAMADDAALPKGLTLPQQILKQMGNVEIRSNGFGINGSITLNGETIKFGDVERLKNDMLKNILNELERPVELPKPVERAEKGEQF